MTSHTLQAIFVQPQGIHFIALSTLTKCCPSHKVGIREWVRKSHFVATPTLCVSAALTSNGAVHLQYHTPFGDKEPKWNVLKSVMGRRWCWQGKTM